MGRYSPLFKSVTILVIFWWLVGFIAYSSLPHWALEQWLEAVGIELDEPVTPLNQLSVIWGEVTRLTRQALIATTAGFVVAACFIALYIYRFRKRISVRANAQPSWRGVSPSRGELLKLPEYSYSARLNLPKSLKLTRKQRACIHSVLGYLSEHKQAYVGPGHRGTLLDHTLGAMSTAIEMYPEDGMLALCTACHDMGKTVAWKKDGEGNWQQLGWHAQEGAKLLAHFPEWWALPNDERLQLRYAVAYNHSPHRLPSKINGLSLEAYNRLKELIDRVREVDGVSTKAEKEDTLASVNLPEEVINSFLNALLDIPYHEDGKQLPKGVKGAGWRVGKRLYLLEHVIRDAAMKRLDENVSAALGGQYRSEGQLAEYTKVLFKELHKRGWLATEFEPHESGLMPGQSIEDADPIKVPAFYPLVKLLSINKNKQRFEFDGVYAIELDEENLRRYPQLDAPGAVFAVAAMRPPEELEKEVIQAQKEGGEADEKAKESTKKKRRKPKSKKQNERKKQKAVEKNNEANHGKKAHEEKVSAAESQEEKAGVGAKQEDERHKDKKGKDKVKQGVTHVSSEGNKEKEEAVKRNEDPAKQDGKRVKGDAKDSVLLPPPDVKREDVEAERNRMARERSKKTSSESMEPSDDVMAALMRNATQASNSAARAMDNKNAQRRPEPED